MKRVIITLVLCFTFLTFSQVFAKEKPRLGVLRFTNNTRAGWWSGTAGQELQDMLAAELVTLKAFQVLERKELEAVIGEQDLGASGRINKSTRSKIGNITGAKYLVMATVSAYEEGTSGTSGGVGFKGISLGGKKETAYLAVDLKIVEVETGEIVDARTVEATAKSGGLGGGLSVGGFSGNLAKQKKTPAGKAIRACVMEIADYLVCSLTKGKDDSCMAGYNAKESKRREKTKGSIDLE